MNWALFLVPLLSIAFLVIIMRMPAKIKRVLLLLSFLFVISFLAFSAFLAQDLLELQGSMRSSEKIFLLVQDGVVRSGFWTAGNFDPLTDDELAAHQQDFAEGTLPSSLERRYFVFDASAFDPTSRIEIDGINATNADILRILKSPSVLQSFSEFTGIPQGLIAAAYSENDLKARLFGYLAQDMLRNPARMIAQYKQGNVLLLPDSLALKTVRVLPTALVEHSFGLLFIVEEEV